LCQLAQVLYRRGHLGLRGGPMIVVDPVGAAEELLSLWPVGKAGSQYPSLARDSFG